MQLKRRIARISTSLALTLALCTLSALNALNANADGLAYVSVVPFGQGPTLFSDSFSGFGYGAGLSYNPHGSEWGGYFRIVNQGKGQLAAFGAHVYLTGRPVPPAIDVSNPDIQLQVRPRVRSLILDFGPSYYKVQQTIDSEGSIEELSGIGALFSVGIEQPIFSSYAVGLRVNYFNSLSNSVSAIFIDISFGLPLGI
jgi:hypothetical protein